MKEPVPFLDPGVRKYLLDEDGEVVVAEVHKHWMAAFWPTSRLVLGLVLFVWAWIFESPLFWVVMVPAMGLIAQALWRMAEEYRDRFVVSNQRVFRVHGLLSQKRATVPLARILDITVDKPLIGRILGYGHFVFESAAQDQGLRDIRYVPRVDDHDKLIQQTMQRAGLRATAAPKSEGPDDGT